MVLPLRTAAAAAVLVAIAVLVSGGAAAEAGPQRILLDTDMDTDRRLARATLHPQAEPLRVRPQGTLNCEGFSKCWIEFFDIVQSESAEDRTPRSHHGSANAQICNTRAGLSF